jgi:hypothetical protein
MRFLLTPILLLTLIFVGCGGGEDSAAESDTLATEPAPVDQTAQRGQGTLTLGDRQYAFNIRICDFSGEVDDDMVQTLVGRGEDAGGEPFEVYVSRLDINGMLTHSISFQQGNVARGEGTVLEAQRIRTGDQWHSHRGGPGTPLIQIEGNRLQAAGIFTPADDDSDRTEGRLEATCPN